MKHWLTISIIIFLIAIGVIVLDSCKKQRFLYTQTSLSFFVPPGFPRPTYNFSANPLTQQGFDLGKKLFYEPKLSSTSYVYCGSCHMPVAAFTTFEHDRSHGVNGNHTLRNAPGLFNLAWYPNFNQDEGVNSLWKVYENHITNPKEMGETVDNVLNKLRQDSSYKRMFREAFNDDKITSENMYKALDQFVISLVSADSRFDKVQQGKDAFTTEEQQGYDVFKNKCAVCHSGILFTDFSLRNIGLEVDPLLNDYGRMRVTGKPQDSLKFRVPSLRNLEFTSYYMHDGRYNLPRNAIKHYEYDIHQSATLDPLLVNGIQLTTSQEDDLVVFLRTLSDSSFLNNPRFR